VFAAITKSYRSLRHVDIEVTGNVIDGAGYGGIFLIGSRHVVSGNRLLGLNRDQCNRRHAPAAATTRLTNRTYCTAAFTGGSGARPTQTVDNRIERNEIPGSP